MKLRKVQVNLIVESDKSIVELKRAKFYAFGVTPLDPSKMKGLDPIDVGKIEAISAWKRPK